MQGSIYIPQIEGKDLVKNNYEIKSLRQYGAVLDYSLESLKLVKEHKRICRNNKFYEYHNGKKYSQDIISVVFNYRNKDNSVAKIRDMLYENGFLCNGNLYVRYKRSSGAARVGKCLFIKQELYKSMKKWSYLNLSYKTDEKIDMAGLEADTSLTLSSIIDTIELHPHNILLIDDYKSVFKDDVMLTKVDKKNKLITSREKTTIINNIWDGQSLMDASMFTKKYEDKGMLLLRNHFFKSCCVNTKLQKYFKDNNITKTSQLNGYTTAKSVKDIKLITTPSSIKYLKYSTYKDWIKHIDAHFGIVKYDKPTHFMDGDCVQTHYQLLNTLKMNIEDVDLLLQDSFNYLRLIKHDIEVFRHHLKMKSESNIGLKKIDTNNDMIYNMLQLNDNVKHTNMFYNFRADTIKSYTNHIRSGHILVNGNYSTLCGNGYEMLQAAIGEFDGTSILSGDEIISNRFRSGKILLGVRSPHVTMGNVWLPKNTRRKEYDKYFTKSQQMVFINSINNNVLQRLNGCDFDSDSILLTDNELLIKSAKKEYKNFLVPTSDVESIKLKRTNNNKSRCDLDIKTSVNLIGEIINLSQILNSHLWELKKKNKDCEDIYKDICKLAVMSCIEIDMAKKEFVVNNKIELKQMRKKWGNIIKKRPIFFSYLTVDKKYNISQNADRFRKYETTMDYVQHCLTKFAYTNKIKREKKLTIKDLMCFDNIRIGGTQYNQYHKVLSIVEKYRFVNMQIWADKTMSNAEKRILSLYEKECVIYKLKNIDISKKVLIYIFQNIETKNQRQMLLFLSQVYREKFEDIFLDTTTPISFIKKWDKKTQEDLVVIYGKLYKKHTILPKKRKQM